MCSATTIIVRWLCDEHLMQHICMRCTAFVSEAIARCVQIAFAFAHTRLTIGMQPANIMTICVLESCIHIEMTMVYATMRLLFAACARNKTKSIHEFIWVCIVWLWMNFRSIAFSLDRVAFSNASLLLASYWSTIRLPSASACCDDDHMCWSVHTLNG